VDHGDTYLDGKGRCTICFPAELQHTNDGEISEDVSNPDSYVGMCILDAESMAIDLILVALHQSRVVCNDKLAEEIHSPSSSYRK